MTPTIDQAYEAPSEVTARGRSLSVMANSTTRGNADDKSTGYIAANDFLTLLIAEMKNQDPTANTDPNQYVNQLVQVNSLQQLISINEMLQSALSTAPRSEAKSSNAAHFKFYSDPANAPSFNETSRRHPVSGNLSTPADKSASSRLATALTGN